MKVSVITPRPAVRATGSHQSNATATTPGAADKVVVTFN